MANVLLLYNEMIPSVRLCGYEQLVYLEAGGKIHFDHCPINNLGKKQIQWADVVIMVRSDSSYEEMLVKAFRRAEKYIIYVLDDDLLNIPPGLPSAIHYRSSEVKERIKNIMRLSNCLCSPSPVILEKYGGLFEKKMLIEEPALNTGFVNCSKDEDGPVKIGFAGSIDRSADFETILSDVIKDLLFKYKQKIQIEFMGARPEICTELELNHFPYEPSYEGYQQQMAKLKWDIGLAPIPDTPFHNCKHFNKYIEYGAFGIVGVYSGVMPYTRVIENGRNGILCENTKEAWIEGISKLIDGFPERMRMRDAIAKDIQEVFSVYAVSELYCKQAGEILIYTAPACAVRKFEYLKIKKLWLRSKDFIGRHGIRFPLEAVKKIIGSNK